MAIDSERKRKSIAAIGRKWHPGVVVPDGSFDQGDRQTIGRSYYGILAGAPSGPTWIGGYTFVTGFTDITDIERQEH